MRATRGAVPLLAFGVGVLAGFLAPETSAGTGPQRPAPEVVDRGRTLFLRTWRPNDIRCQNGDGLGPVYNETSCVACHNLGGVGGGGSNRRNVVLLTPVVNNCPSNGVDSTLFQLLTGSIKTQIGLRTFTTSVVHKFGTSPDYQDWLNWLKSKTSFDGFTLHSAQRNTPALFGAGLIDTLPDEVLLAQEKRLYPDFPSIQGRVSRLKGGAIGRFGWKGQIASLDDFVRTACSVELGLEAPGHHQSPDPSNPKDVTSELDLTEADCQALVGYVASLPAPVLIEPSMPSQARRMAAGGALFKAIGCAACHTPKLGPLEGVYSDLLLHDLGSANSGDGSYSSGNGGTDPAPPLVNDPNAAGAGETPKVLGALSGEWRTTPLWGLRDSGPYMHDGKAKSLESAIARHAGQAVAVRERYDALSGEQKMQLHRFLLSLAAPPGAETFVGSPDQSRRQ